eukprot:Nitzschia sp. Nitz4//scaffold76_size158648//130885//132553//NITZ4_002567-RA/size158648-augustus-gene-0.144-mRNA-1//1//CDS//3329557908//8442//frame0
MAVHWEAPVGCWMSFELLRIFDVCILIPTICTIQRITVDTQDSITPTPTSSLILHNPMANTMTNESSSAPKEIDKPLNINDRCEVKWRNGDFNLKAKIVERRPLSLRTNPSLKRGASLPPVDGLKPDEVEYYIHYVEHDRRLDEWVTLDKFVLDTLERVEESETPPEAEDSRKSRRRVHSSADFGDNGPSAESILSGGNFRTGSGDPSLAELEREHEETTKVKNIEKIWMGNFEVECWYFSPYPDEYAHAETLYVCEYCLKYMKKRSTFRKHLATCEHRNPPGKEIYRELGLSVYEVDGKEHRVYCQNLCLLAKLFLDHKTLYYDVDPFYFYIICAVDDHGAHIVGYFSKEKQSAEEYNLACILTFPQYQKHGYGKFIISLSYELSKREQTTGSPEKPLSDLGKISYRSYWTHVLLHLLASHDPKTDISIKDISIGTGIKTEDIISTLQYLDMIKCWKGQHVVYVNQKTIADYMSQKKQLRLCKSENLHWEPPRPKTSSGS